MADQRKPKRQAEGLEKTSVKVAKSTETQFIRITRDIWNKGSKKVKSAMTEDQDFHEFFKLRNNIKDTLLL